MNLYSFGNLVNHSRVIICHTKSKSRTRNFKKDANDFAEEFFQTVAFVKFKSINE